MSKEILPYERSGNASSDHIVVFLHGWPDTTALWNDVIKPIEKEYFILNITYPNYSEEQKLPKGLDFEEMAHRIRNTVDHVNDTKRKIVFVTHDWGCIYGYYVDLFYPKYIHHMVALDVGGKFSGRKFLIIFYQLVLLIAFLIGGFIGKYMTHWIMKFFKYQPPWMTKVDGSWNYPYYYIWKKIIKAGGNAQKGVLVGYEPSCPLAFAWGTKKPVQFFSSDWVAMLSKDPKHEILSVKCGHWIPRDQKDFVVDLIRKRINMFKEFKISK